jgi:hypothetical protein
MIFFVWLVLCLVAGTILLLPLFLWRREIFNRYSGGRPVACPETHQTAVVNFDARHAAATATEGVPDLCLSDCTLWPERSQCAQACLPQALRAQPYSPAERRVTAKPIYHLPVLLAAFIAWYLGIIWHSHYLFRTQWMNSIGLTREQVRHMVEWNAAHLLTIAVCLLFAYGVAGLLAVCHRKGVLQGVLMSLLLCGVVVASSWYGIERLPHELLVIEAGYTLLATLIVGAIVGGLNGKLVLRSR